MSDLADVQRELYAINTRWYDLGLELGLKAPSLHSIYSKHPGDTSQCFCEVLKVWLKGVDPPPTWELLEKARKSLPPNLQPRKCPTFAYIASTTGELCHTVHTVHTV